MVESSGQEYRRSASGDPDEVGSPMQDETTNAEAGQARGEQYATWTQPTAEPGVGEEVPPQDSASSVDPAAEAAAPGTAEIDASGAPAEDLVIGTPEQDVGTWDGVQSYDNCQIRVEEFLIELYTGQEVSEDALVQEAIDKDLTISPGSYGVAPEDSGKLLEAHGIPVNNYENATTYDLANELAQGHKVIIGIDAYELWGDQPPILDEVYGIADRDDNHAVVVSGIDTTDPDNPRVIISDPGNGDAAATYPMDHFLAAWQDSNFSITATAEPAPSTLPEMSNFDYEAGHIPEVACIPYEDFAQMQDQPEEWDALLGLIAQDQTYVTQEAPPETVGQNIVDQGAPDGEAIVPPELLDTSLPGPTLDASLFDPNAPGPTIDPCCVNPDAPGPTINPALLDPLEPGLTLDPALLDPNSPGPTVDAGLFDPNAPGPTIDPYAPLPSNLQQPLQNTTAPAAVAQSPVQQTTTQSGVDSGTVPGSTPEDIASGQETEPQPVESATENLPDGSI